MIFLNRKHFNNWIGMEDSVSGGMICMVTLALSLHFFLIYENVFGRDPYWTHIFYQLNPARTYRGWSPVSLT